MTKLIGTCVLLWWTLSDSTRFHLNITQTIYRVCRKRKRTRTSCARDIRQRDRIKIGIRRMWEREREKERVWERDECSTRRHSTMRRRNVKTADWQKQLIMCALIASGKVRLCSGLVMSNELTPRAVALRALHRVRCFNAHLAVAQHNVNTSTTNPSLAPFSARHSIEPVIRWVFCVLFAREPLQ